MMSQRYDKAQEQEDFLVKFFITQITWEDNEFLGRDWIMAGEYNGHVYIENLDPSMLLFWMMKRHKYNKLSSSQDTTCKSPFIHLFFYCLPLGPYFKIRYITENKCSSLAC